MMSRILPIGCLLLAIALFFGYMKPTWSGDIAEKKMQIQSFDNALEASKQYKEKEAELTTLRNSIAPEDLARLNAFLPDNVDNVQIILDLDALAYRSGVKLSNFDIKTATAPTVETNPELAGGLEKPNAVDTADITLKVSGTYSSFRSFLASVEQSLRLLDVVSLKIADSKTGVYTYDMTIRIYSLH